MTGRAILVAVLMFMVGLALGVGVDRHVLSRHAMRHSHGAMSHDAVIAQLDTLLDLTAVQHESLTVVAKRHQASVDSAWDVMNGRLRMTIDSARHEMESFLTPEQVRKFDAWFTTSHRLPSR